MQNPEFLHSVLSSLPGVNPEEALHNLEQMTDQDQDDQVSEWVGVVANGRRATPASTCVVSEDHY